MSGSEGSIEYFAEESNRTPGPVSPNLDLMTSQPTSFSPSISNTSMDGSNASESVNESLTSDPELQQAFSFMEQMNGNRSRNRNRNRSRTRSRSATSNRHSDTELSDLRTVPASTNLRPRERDESGRRLNNRRRWASMSRSISASPSPSSSSSGSPLPPHIAQVARNLRGNRTLTTFEAATIAHHVSQMVIDMNDRLPMTPARLRRIRRHRRIQARAQAQAQSILDSLLGTTSSSSDDDSEPRPPRSSYTQVPRRGNSVSDCSQCSSDEDSKGKKTEPDPLEEWLYPV